MSGLKVKQLKTRLKVLFEEGIDLFGIGEADPNREEKLLSRCLAAFSIYNATGCSGIEAAQSVWDGGDDNGIDAAYYDPAEKQVVLVQSKWIQSGIGEPSAADVSVFVDGIKDLIENNLDAFGERLQDKADEISLHLMQPGTTVRIVLASTGASTLANPAQTKLDRLISELNKGDEDGIATSEVIGMIEVFAGLAEGARAGKIALNATLLDWSRVSHPQKAYFGIIDGSQLKSWWSSHGKRLVAQNIRYGLGNTPVNEEIQETAENRPEHFWYFQNGITLIADEVSRAPSAAASHSSGNFEFRGASIVNGAQTVSTLSKVEDDEAVGRVRTSIRVVILDEAPDNFGADVTRTNNLQNRVEGRDFVANDPQHTRLRGEMSMEGIDYQFHRSEDFQSSETACELIEVTTALACASDDPSHAVAAKTGVGRFFNDLSKALYKAIFNPTTSGARAFNSVRVLRMIEKWIAEKKRKADRKSGYAWGLLVHGNRSLASAVFKKVGDGQLGCPIGDFDPNLESVVNSACESSYDNLLGLLEKEFPNKALAVLFKNNTSCRYLYENA